MTSVAQIRFGVPIVVKSACKHKVLSNEFDLQGRKVIQRQNLPYPLSLPFHTPLLPYTTQTKFWTSPLWTKPKPKKMSEYFATH